MQAVKQKLRQFQLLRGHIRSGCTLDALHRWSRTSSVLGAGPKRTGPAKSYDVEPGLQTRNPTQDQLVEQQHDQQ
jgi:hypothetical protein